ncbi:hypothetical protein AMATHDRAFT_52988 [Amanita thiersii Skay4041]|uniref:TAP42-like protein n=1 Tax=Amanita thiersii Skay4041 TaxID=703135 RepID=A0A2A9NVM7_9AGAR|nr:hypothetical protein AMATHDRAFT_52988 [Amanita thiersii Skay4041]
MSLSQLFANALSTASKVVSFPTIQDSTQELIQYCLRDLNVLQSRVTALSLFSPNETFEDIGTRDLVYLFVPYVLSEVQGRVRTTEPAERMQVLNRAQGSLTSFLSNLDNFEIVPAEERLLYEYKTSPIRDAKQRREMKIKQYQKEKDLRAKIDEIRRRQGLHQFITDDEPNNFDLISMLLPSAGTRQSAKDDEIDSDTEDALREVTLLLLRLMYAQSQVQMESMDQEREILKHTPPPPIKSENQREQHQTAEESMWKLDAPQVPKDGKGPLLDSSGKPLQPFTILPSDAGTRARLQAQVFGPSHRLPTMTIDEYLAIERQRGNILTGGGRASTEAPTSKEKLEIAAEMEGTREGEEMAEEKRQKDEQWAQYTDENPRGAGNTMNRG